MNCELISLINEDIPKFLPRTFVKVKFSLKALIIKPARVAQRRQQKPLGNMTLSMMYMSWPSHDRSPSFPSFHHHHPPRPGRRPRGRPGVATARRPLPGGTGRGEAV